MAVCVGRQRASPIELPILRMLTSDTDGHLSLDGPARTDPKRVNTAQWDWMGRTRRRATVSRTDARSPATRISPRQPDLVRGCCRARAIAAGHLHRYTVELEGERAERADSQLTPDRSLVAASHLRQRPGVPAPCQPRASPNGHSSHCRGHAKGLQTQVSPRIAGAARGGVRQPQRQDDEIQRCSARRDGARENATHGVENRRSEFGGGVQSVNELLIDWPHLNR
jgi:hypothetical protein